MTFVFLAANAVLLSKWHWDQLKIFLGLYVVLLFIWSEAETRSSRWLQLLCMPLLLPACFELYGIYKKLKPFQVYSETDVRRAEEIRHVVPADAAILAAPNHNSLVTLTGRSIYLGYDGTLWSHGIEYAKRRARTEKLLEINRCSVESNAEFPEACPEYLLWQHQERNKLSLIHI